jgi:hypothetical protein
MPLPTATRSSANWASAEVIVVENFFEELKAKMGS